jgi:hypothetical protein
MTQSFDEDVAPEGTETVPTATETAPVGTETVPTATETVPARMAAEFSSLTTPYCWVVTEDLVAGYDGAEPSAVGKFGPPDAVPGDVFEALCTGRWFRLTGVGGVLAVGRSYDPSGDNERAPVAEIDQPAWEEIGIEYRQGGEWEAS